MQSNIEIEHEDKDLVIENNTEQGTVANKKTNYYFLLGCMAGLTGAVVASAGYYLATASALKLGALAATAAIASTALSPVVPIVATGLLLAIGSICLLPFLLCNCLFSQPTRYVTASYPTVTTSWPSFYPSYPTYPSYPSNHHNHGQSRGGEVIVSGHGSNGNIHQHQGGHQHGH